MKIFLAIAVVLSLLSPRQLHAETGSGVVTFGIVPQQSASRLAEMWGPFLSELSKRTGVTVQFRTTKDIPTFEACLADGAFDVAYMNPMHYAIFSAESGYRAFAKQAKKRLKGIVVVRKDSEVDALEVLADGQIAFPSPGAFGASILTRAALSERNIPFEPSYVNSHDSVYRAVAMGLMDAGGGVSRTFGATAPEMRDKLRILYETPGFTPHAFGTSPDIDPKLAKRLESAFLEIAEEKPELVEQIGMVGLTSADDEDWDDVRALDMDRDGSGILRQGQVTCPSV